MDHSWVWDVVRAVVSRMICCWMRQIARCNERNSGGLVIGVLRDVRDRAMVRRLAVWDSRIGTEAVVDCQRAAESNATGAAMALVCVVIFLVASALRAHVLVIMAIVATFTCPVPFFYRGFRYLLAASDLVLRRYNLPAGRRPPAAGGAFR